MESSNAKCPHCQQQFKALLTNHDGIDYDHTIAPILCDRCLEVSLLIDGHIRLITSEELHLVKQSEAWLVIQKARQVITNSRRAANANNN